MHNNVTNKRRHWRTRSVGRPIKGNNGRVAGWFTRMSFVVQNLDCEQSCKLLMVGSSFDSYFFPCSFQPTSQTACLFETGALIQCHPSKHMAVTWLSDGQCSLFNADGCKCIMVSHHMKSWLSIITLTSAMSICPLRNVQPHPTSLVSVEPTAVSMEIVDQKFKCLSLVLTSHMVLLGL